MRERVFRVEYCDKECLYPDRGACFEITLDSIETCVRCKYQEIPEHNWICAGCGREFDRLEKRFEVTTGPDMDEILEAPERHPGVRVVPLVTRIKWLCRDCYARLQG